MKILVADDHQSVVDDISYELRELVPDAKITGTADPDSIRTLCQTQKFDIVFLDIDLGNENGIQIAKEILFMQPRVNIIYITGYEEYALESYETSASGFLLKPITTAKIKKALSTLRFPVSTISDEVLTKMSAGNTVIGAKIWKYREECGLSREKFSQMLGVDSTTVYRWEKGIRLPDIVTLVQIAKALGIEISDLVQ